MGKKSEFQKAVDQVAKIIAKNQLDYEQTKNLFKEVRKKLELKAKPRKKGTVKRLSRSQLESFMTAAFDKSAKIGLMMMVLYETGLRNSEFCNLDTDDIYFNELKIVVREGKGDKRREIPISKHLANSLQIYLENHSDGPVFRNNRYKRYSSRSLQLIVKDLREETGIKLRVTPHVMRHTRATLLLEEGLSKDLLQKFLGHSKPETTEIYTNTANLQLNKKFQELETK